MAYTKYNSPRTSLEDSELGQTNAQVHTYEETFTLTILFYNFKRAVIDNVTDYGICSGNPDVFWFKRHRLTNFMPKDGVIYFGREDDCPAFLTEDTQDA